MTRKELHDKIADAIKDAFQAGKQRTSDGSQRPHLLDEDCKVVADLVYSTIGNSDLGIYDVRSITEAKI